MELQSANRRVLRYEYRACLKSNASSSVPSTMAECRKNAASAIRDGKLMTAALYYYGRQLFLYYEALGKPLLPGDFLAPLDSALELWPEKEQLCRWAEMYPIYWHDVPQDAAGWSRGTHPEQRRGRIALLKHDTMFEYCYHHEAIVKEGLLQGDRYQFISLHEDVLFSYFEEPKHFTNIQHKPEIPSQAIHAWEAVDPEAHFIPLPGSNGQNFLLLPNYFTISYQDI